MAASHESPAYASTSVGAVAADIRKATDMLQPEVLEQTRQAVNETATIITEATHGTGSITLQEAHAGISTAVEKAANAAGRLAAGRMYLSDYLSAIGASGTEGSEKIPETVVHTLEGSVAEKQLFTKSIARLEQGAASGELTGGVPTDFLVGIEMEGFLLPDIPNRENMLANYPNLSLQDQMVAQKMVLPETPTIPPTDERRQQLIIDGRRQAREYVQTIPANTPEAQALKEKWLADVDNFGPEELINFEIYREFSKPVAEIPVVPGNASYDEVTKFSNEHGWLEFRFGTGKLQTGYYDHEGTTEVRLTPCPPTEAAHRKAVVTKRFGEIAATYGMSYLDNSMHLNVSAYQKDERGEKRPIIGTDPEQREKTLDVLTGLQASMADGVWLNTSNARRPEFFDVNGEGGEAPMVISHARTTVRMHSDRFENRADVMTETVEQGIAVSIGGAIAGLHHGREALAGQGYDVPQVKQSYRVHREPDFDKERHLYVQRALQNVVTKPDGGLEIEDSFNMEKSVEVATALLGADLNIHQLDAYLLNQALTRSMTVDDQGRATVSAERFRASVAAMQESPDSLVVFYAEKAPVVASLVNNTLATVRLEPAELIEGKTGLKHLSPANREQKLLASPVAQLLYDQDLPAFAARVRSAGEHAQER